MITESPSNREVYLTEVSRQLRKAGFTVGSMQDGLLPVSMEEHQVCQINSKGTVFFQPESIGQELEPARKRASDIVWETAEYIRLLEQAPPLKAEGLSSPYKVLAEFNGVVLAGELTGYGAQFATWQWVQGRTGLWQGHYHSSYENAKRDFTTRSGLLLESALFTPEQMAEIYLCIDLELDGRMYLNRPSSLRCNNTWSPYEAVSEKRWPLFCALFQERRQKKRGKIMARYFMEDTRLAGLERMMMDSSRTPPIRTEPRRKRPQKKLPRDRPIKPRPHEQKIRGDNGEGGV